MKLKSPSLSSRGVVQGVPRTNIKGKTLGTRLRVLYLCILSLHSKWRVESLVTMATLHCDMWIRVQNSHPELYQSTAQMGRTGMHWDKRLNQQLRSSEM